MEGKLKNKMNTSLIIAIAYVFTVVIPPINVHGWTDKPTACEVIDFHMAGHENCKDKVPVGDVGLHGLGLHARLGGFTDSRRCNSYEHERCVEVEKACKTYMEECTKEQKLAQIMSVMAPKSDSACEEGPNCLVENCKAEVVKAEKTTMDAREAFAASYFQ